MAIYTSRLEVILIVSKAIAERNVLKAIYDHTDGSERVEHRLAPFDVGSTNPKTAVRFVDALWAYSFTHINDKTGLLEPKVCRFDVNHFVSLMPAGEKFDELQVTLDNKVVTGYDYRDCKFCLLPDRDWYV